MEIGVAKIAVQDSSRRLPDSWSFSYSCCSPCKRLSASTPDQWQPMLHSRALGSLPAHELNATARLFPLMPVFMLKKSCASNWENLETELISIGQRQHGTRSHCGFALSHSGFSGAVFEAARAASIEQCE